VSPGEGWICGRYPNPDGFDGGDFHACFRSFVGKNGATEHR
jgi:hypothetical protein